jgi:hypothetical protein
MAVWWVPTVATGARHAEAVVGAAPESVVTATLVGRDRASTSVPVAEVSVQEEQVMEEPQEVPSSSGLPRCGSALRLNKPVVFDVVDP